jgi:SpoVK/Ycf46/Vps4 family AAA+-type ATPase
MHSPFNSEYTHWHLPNVFIYFTGADISALCTEAAMCPLRELAARGGMGGLQRLQESEVPSISLEHFLDARREVSASVSQENLQQYVQWNTQYGTYRRME